MAKTKLSEYSATAASNTDINSINIDEGMSPSNVNNAIRELMAQLKNMEDGTDAVTAIKSGNIQITSNTISSTDTNGNINITPNGNGNVVLDGINYPQADGTADYFLKTDGAGQLSFAQVDTASIADDAITSAKIADNSIGAAALNVSGNGTAGQVLKSDGDGSFTWADTAEPFTPTTVSGTTPSLDLGTYNFFSQGSLTGNTTLSFANVPTAKRFAYDFTSTGFSETYAFDSISSVDSATAGGGSYVFDDYVRPIVNSDGTKMLVYGSDSTLRITTKEYSMSTAYDVSTLSYVDEWRGVSQYLYGRGIAAKPDGTRYYLLYYNANNNDLVLYQEDLSTDFDLTTRGSNTYFTIASSLSDTHQGLQFSHDGTKFFITENTTTVKGWTLSTAWDISTASRDSSLDSGSSLISNPEDLVFNGDGTVGAVGNTTTLNIYDLSTAYDWSTATLDVSKSVSGLVGERDGFNISQNGQHFFSSSHPAGGSTTTINSWNIYGTTAYTLTLQHQCKILIMQLL